MKKQFLTFKHPELTEFYSVLDQLPIDIDDADFVNFIQTLPGEVEVNYDWDSETSTLNVTRIWPDHTYDEYMANWKQNRDDSEARLEAAGYELTEVVTDLP